MLSHPEVKKIEKKVSEYPINYSEYFYIRLDWKQSY